MELIRKAVGNSWLPGTTESMAKMTRQVTEEEWLAQEENFLDTEGGTYVHIETNSDDMTKIEALLGVLPGFFGGPIVIKTSERYCGSCGRENNFLDVIATGLRVHSPQFLVDVFTGKYGDRKSVV